MAKYMLLILGDRHTWADTAPEEQQRISAGHQAFAATLGKAILAGYELAPADTAMSLRSRGSERPQITRGPFAAVDEVIGGYYVIEAEDLDMATRLAELLPETNAPYSAGVEIRQVVEPTTS
ncbi:MAG: hypothetical protein J0I43_06325 [Microbacterium sp.]|uniref:YciI family protein n=1 Tax=Microbacterium sp. TaxID=51671 RepID=UPI001AC5BB82|nr:YciI family protein [Microbacterium sp.]MBN9176966.1 hypothetical protein [Microbacterium sp.]